MKRFKKLILCIISVCCIIVSMCPISAFASPVLYYPIASDKPTVTDFSGYVELLFEDKSSGLRFVSVLGWFFTPTLNTSTDLFKASDKPIIRLYRDNQFFRIGVQTHSGVEGNLSLVYIDSSEQVVLNAVPIPDDNDEFFYRVDFGSSVALIGFHCYGSFDMITESGPDEEFYVSYGSDAVISYGVGQILSGIYSLIDVVGQESYKDELDSILDGINNLDSSLSSYHHDFNLRMTQMFSWFSHFLDGLNSIIENTDELEGKLDEVIAYLISIDNWLFNINDWTMNSYMELYEIHSIVQSILDVLNIQSDIPAEKLTQPDNSDMDNYYEIENGLLDSGNADVNGAVNVQVNQNAMTVIWDLVESALNSHSKVIGMVLTILALGIVALILGR